MIAVVLVPSCSENPEDTTATSTLKKLVQEDTHKAPKKTKPLKSEVIHGKSLSILYTLKINSHLQPQR